MLISASAICIYADRSARAAEQYVLDCSSNVIQCRLPIAQCSMSDVCMRPNESGDLNFCSMLFRYLSWPQLPTSLDAVACGTALSFISLYKVGSGHVLFFMKRTRDAAPEKSKLFYIDFSLQQLLRSQNDPAAAGRLISAGLLSTQ